VCRCNSSFLPAKRGTASTRPPTVPGTEQPGAEFFGRVPPSEARCLPPPSARAVAFLTTVVVAAQPASVNTNEHETRSRTGERIARHGTAGFAPSSSFATASPVSTAARTMT
jgi:hypothetical protein